MRIKRFGVCIAALCAVAAVSAATETGDKEPFWLGGDISGMNATRLRVWVNPKDGLLSGGCAEDGKTFTGSGYACDD